MTQDPGDFELIARIKKNDMTAFEVLVRRYEVKVRSLCLSMVGPATCEDAAQEVFLKVLDAISGFRGSSAFSTWLYRVTANHCLNILAKRKREKQESLDAWLEVGGHHQLSTKGPSLGAQAENRQSAEAILSRLDPKERAILTLREVEGLSYQEIAATLEISLDAAKVRLFRARKAMIEVAQELQIIEKTQPEEA